MEEIILLSIVAGLGVLYFIDRVQLRSTKSTGKRDEISMEKPKH